MIDIKTGKHFTTPSARSQMTRGGFLRGILASGIAPSITLGLISASTRSDGGVSRGMMRNVGVRNAAMGGGGAKPTANDYVKDGLIGLWDGIEKDVFGGKSNCTSWTNLISTETTNHGVGNPTGESFTFDGTNNGQIGYDSGRYFSSFGAVEVVFKSNAKNTDGWLFTGSAHGYGNLFIFHESGYLNFGSSINNGKAVREIIGEKVSASWNFQSGTVFINSSQATVVRSKDYWTLWGTQFGGRGYNDPGHFYNGELMCIRVYSKELTTNEISANYAIDKARFNLT